MIKHALGLVSAFGLDFLAGVVVGGLFGPKLYAKAKVLYGDVETAVGNLVGHHKK